VGDVDGAGRTVASAGKDALSHGMGRTGSGDGVGWNSAGVLDSEKVAFLEHTSIVFAKLQSPVLY